MFSVAMACDWCHSKTYETGDWTYMLQFGGMAALVGGFVGMVRTIEKSL